MIIAINEEQCLEDASFRTTLHNLKYQRKECSAGAQALYKEPPPLDRLKGLESSEINHHR